MADNNRSSLEMRIGAVRVTGFRALKDVCVTLDPEITVLVGENNTGKSAFLEALATALGTRAPILDDLHIDTQGNRCQEFRVDLLLLPTVGNSFEGRLINLFGNTIRKTEDREYIAIRTIGSVGADRSTVNRRRCFIEGWSDCDNIGDLAETEISGEQVTERHLSVISFAILEASRDLVSEMHKSSSRWGRLLAQRDLDPQTADNIEEQLKKLGKKILDESPLLSRLVTRLDEAQEALPTIGEVELEPLPSRIDDLTRATDVLINTPDGMRLPLRMQGLGSRSLAEMMVYRAFANELPGIEEPYTPHLIACFEEPEAHLHPQAQHSVMHIIAKMKGQGIITTHSPQIASEVNIRQIRLFRYSNSDIEVRSSGVLDKKELIRTKRLIERTQGQVYFARLAIFVEGDTEYDSIPIFAECQWKVKAESRGITFVNSGSPTNAVPLIKLLDYLDVPWLILVDGDQGGYEALDKIGNAISRALDENSPEVTILPDGMNFERYLIYEGLQEPIKQGIKEMYGIQSIADLSNYDEDEYLEKFLNKRKGSYGAAVAEAIVDTTDAHGNPIIPGRIAELLEKADRILESGSI